MANEETYYVQIICEKALLILERDYEDNSMFATGSDSLTYSLVEVVDINKYTELLTSESNNNWKTAIKVTSEYEFIECNTSEWCSYSYQNQGNGNTTERTVIDFSKMLEKPYQPDSILV